ncbi:HNH endonuclease [Pseudomonas sp. B35(2017)]|uniref:HNH endonuclease n=1 Tax=Pseudomonas sp. B35(2017) TaxID=1981722 RepID=UPI000A1FF366|nr:HNH endonuclease [Pseudomonas sp. B35(2017)]
MDNCYLCGKGLTSENMHEEHVIQNAIGGTLSPDDILCKFCGNELSSSVDTPFISIFSKFCTRLDIKVDRPRSKKRTQAKKVNGRIGDVEVNIHDGRVLPSKPQHLIVDGVLYVFSQEEHAEGYANKVVSSMAPDSVSGVKYFSDLTGMGNVAIPFELDNVVYKRGLAKIAIGYASSLGVSRSEMPAALDAEKGEIRQRIDVVPFVPVGEFDDLFERSRFYLDEDYPSHMLKLFTRKYRDPVNEEVQTWLICYVELFGTFQHYVILNYDFKGEVDGSYRQLILKKEAKSIVEMLGPKEMHYVLSEVGIAAEELVGLSDEEVLTKIRAEYDRQKYRTSVEEFTDRIITAISTVARFVSVGIPAHCDPELEELVRAFFGEAGSRKNFDAMMGFMKNTRLYQRVEYFEESDEEVEVIDSSSFRCAYFDFGGASGGERKCSFTESLKVSLGEFDRVVEYGHYKFGLLSEFIERKSGIKFDLK